MGLTQDFAGLVEPDDPAWARASSSVKRRYYDQAGIFVLDELAAQLGKGIGRNGRQMRVRVQPVLADGADGPVMEPHYDHSRVITLADYSATDHGLKLWWHAGTGHASHRRARAKGAKATPFGTILEYHAEGLVPHAPVRDVRLCAARIRNVRRRLEAVWKSLSKQVRPGPGPTPTPTPPSPVKGVAVKTTLPKGTLKRPGLIDTAALRGRPGAPRPMAPARRPAGTTKPAGAMAAKGPRTQAAATPYTQTPARVAAFREKMAGYKEGDRKVREILKAGSRYAELDDVVTARRADLAAAEARLEGLKAGPGKDAVNAEIRAAMIAVDQAKRERDAVAGKTRFLVQQVLGVREEFRLKFRADLSAMPEEARQTAEGAANWLSAMTARGKAFRVAFKVRRLTSEEEGRCFYDPEETTVVANPWSPVTTYVHEYGHMLEHQVPGWNDAAQAFLRHRTGDEPVAQLRTVPGLKGEGFDADEWGRKDRWEDVFGDQAWYVGKDYGFTASEITAMGLEMLHSDPVTFARKDPEFVKFLCGMLDGVLR